MEILKRPRIGLATLALVYLFILMSGFFAPYDPSQQNRSLTLVPPSHIHFALQPFIYAEKMRGEQYEEDQSKAFPIHFLFQGHLFGVDEPARLFLLGSDVYGRDQFSRFLYGGRISLLAGLLATVVSIAVGMLLGSLAGFYGGWADQVIMRTAEVFLALPWLYLLFAVRAFLPLAINPGRVFLLLLVVMGAVGWARPARLIRGVVLSVKEREYVLAARTFGASGLYLLRRHIFPEVLGVALAQATILIPRYVLAEVALSFFGLGVSEPSPSWGNLLASLRQYQVLESYRWMFLPVLLLIPIFLAYYDVCSYYVRHFAPSTMDKTPFDADGKQN
jgi:peptide/nickel transport system permease protein